MDNNVIFGAPLTYLSKALAEFVMTFFCETKCLHFVSALKKIKVSFKIKNEEPRLGHLKVFGKSPTELNIRTSFVQYFLMWLFSGIWK